MIYNTKYHAFYAVNAAVVWRPPPPTHTVGACEEGWHGPWATQLICHGGTQKQVGLLREDISLLLLLSKPIAPFTGQ